MYSCRLQLFNLHPIDLNIYLTMIFTTAGYGTYKRCRCCLYIVVKRLPPSTLLSRRILSIRWPNRMYHIQSLECRMWQRYEKTHQSSLLCREIERPKRLLNHGTQQEVLLSLEPKPARACIDLFSSCPSVLGISGASKYSLRGRGLFFITNLNTISLFSMLYPPAQSASSFPIVT
jgi:hypothetical protein